jgi:SAM-dependent methyltransferase
MSRFDKEALIWDSKPEVVQSTQAFYETLKQRIPRLTDSNAKLTILDLGCGTGLVSQRLAECEGVAKVVGVDTSKGMVEVFNSKAETLPHGSKMKGIVKLLEDPEDPVLDGQKFNYALMHLTLHHVPDMEPLIQTLAGTLSSGGQIILSDFENDGDHAKLFHPESKWGDVERHGLKRREMEDILKAAKLEDIKVDHSFTLPKTVEKGGEEGFGFLLGIGTKR